MARLAVLDRERCKPNECGTACIRFCPEVRNRIEAIRFEKGEEKPVIVESLCSGCGICIKKCPFQAISIVNLPGELDGECSHRYGPNAFKLFRLPLPQPGTITGLIGRNGIGKTTALRILSGDLKPNLGQFDSPPSWQEIAKYHRGSTLQDYFRKIGEKTLRVVNKPQYVDRIPAGANKKVSDILKKVDERGKTEWLVDQLQLRNVLDRKITVLSGGELQRVALVAAISRDADVYIFDEPSSHLDVDQRMRASMAIRTLIEDNKTVFLAEHDLAMLDYLSDQVCLLYGQPGVYGIVSHVHGVRVGINLYLDGFIPDENMRFRPEPIRFHLRPPREVLGTEVWSLDWHEMRLSLGNFNLSVEPGEVRRGEVVGILGPNGIGKTTFIKLLAGIEKPQVGNAPQWKEMTIGYKPQYISAQYVGSVQMLLRDVAGDKFESESFQNELVKPLGLTDYVERDVKDLSGGELQRVAIAACLAKEALIYLLDEPSAYLDVEERLAVAKAIRKTTESKKAFAFVVEHDIVAQDFVADRLMIFDGEAGIRGIAHAPTSLREGMNIFLSNMKVTFRRDPETGRPRVNKPDSRTDRIQREVGEYYYTATTGE
jgi:ATP-binding cassette, sub-family E, member 1